MVLCRTESQAREVMRRLRMILDRLRLTLHPDKTRVVRLGLGQEGFTFLGCYIRVMRSHFKGRTYVFRWPSPRAMARVRERVRRLTARARRAGMKDMREVIRDLNPVLRGWGNYFRTGNASIKFRAVDQYVHDRLVALMTTRGGACGNKGRKRAAVRHDWPHERFVKELGLYRLLGTIRYPGAAHAT